MVLLGSVRDWLWGPTLMITLIGTGAYLTFGLRAITFRRLGHAFVLLAGGRNPKGKTPGDITPFQALTTVLSSTIGTGNIAGVATAIFLGGPGAVFWMWVTALTGMAAKFSETVCAITFRKTGPGGSTAGGPMYYIVHGLGPRWKWLAVVFAISGSFAAFGIGNLVQSNSVAHAMRASLGIPFLVTGIALAALTGLVIIGGIGRIGKVTEVLVPFMAAIYTLGALWLIARNYKGVPECFWLIFRGAFSGTAAAGGFAGASVLATIRTGITRGVFSNEDGLGSAAIGHAAAKTSDPVRQGLIAMLGSVIDTLVMCTLTALVILLTGKWTSGLTGAELSAVSFREGLPGPGDFIVSFGLVTFALSTILGWAYYAEKCIEFLFGSALIPAYRLIWTAAVALGAVAELPLVWMLSDIMNALMAWPNLIALIALSPVSFRLARQYERRMLPR